jgi:2-iminobutanoate/2-iminopropanoate deaminase
MRFAPAIRVESGPLLFVSGQTGRGADGNVVARDDLTAQTRQAFSNLRDLLEAGGSSLDNVVKLTYFVTDMSEWEIVAAVRSEFFSTYSPASTTVEVSRLWDEACLIEIEAVAAVTDPRGSHPAEEEAPSSGAA